MKRNVLNKRTDKKGRRLHTGESQKKDGRYVYKYQDRNGEPQFVYSWKLEEHDPLPKGKRPCIALREKEKEIQRNKLDGIDSRGGKMTLCELYIKHNNLNPNVVKSTEKNRQCLVKILSNDPIGSMNIDKIKPSDAKAWAIRMSQNYAYHTVHNAKRSLTAAFYTAIADDYVRKNPFTWRFDDVIEDDTTPKTPLTEKQVHSLLSFVKEDQTYSKHYDALFILFHTGLRISELCGLTTKDLDFQNDFIKIDHQLLKDSSGYRVTSTKTESSVRMIPMSKEVRNRLIHLMNNESSCMMEIDGYSDFLFLQDNGSPMYAVRYAKIFTAIWEKYNKCHEGKKLPKLTPHLCRHTFCTHAAQHGFAAKNLQYVMGHSNVTTTFDYYAHGSAQAAKEEMDQLIAF